MKLPKAILIGAALLSLGVNPASAADLPPATVQPATVAPAMPMAPAFSWAGPYVGIAGTLTTCATCTLGGQLGLRAGYDFAFGSRFVAGINAEAFISTDFVIFVPGVEANGRLGVVLGDRALAYLQAGAGYFFGFGSTYFTAGGGLAVALGDRTSVYGEVMPYWIIPGSPIWRFSLGIDRHLGR